MTKELSIGTAQFGLDYGVTNKEGQISEKEAGKILAMAADAGIQWIDTAQSYGNAEQILGRQLPVENSFKLVNKLQAQEDPCFTQEDTYKWEKRFQVSCYQLKTTHIDTFMLHSSRDLKKEGSEHLEDWLLSLKDRGLVRRLGISLYDSAELVDLNTQMLDVVQIPISLFDQRPIKNGTIGILRDMGVAIQARSLYLQGLLAVSPGNLPKWTTREFQVHHRALFDTALQKKCTLVELALGFAKSQVDIEAIVVGICNMRQLEELIAAWKDESPWEDGEWQQWGWDDENILDPRKWPKNPRI